MGKSWEVVSPQLCAVTYEFLINMWLCATFSSVFCSFDFILTWKIESLFIIFILFFLWLLGVWMPATDDWSPYLSFNLCIWVIQIWQGQYKSTLVCPVCGKVSVTFDPFMYLSLPLQFTVTRTMTVTVFTSDGSALPIPCTVNVPKQGRCRDLIQAISGACSLKSSERLLLAEVCQI